MPKKIKVKLEFAANVHPSQKGIALVMVLWVLAMLTVIVLSFSYAVRVETHSTLAFKELAEKKFLAEAGIERAIMELLYGKANQGQTITLDGMDVWKTDNTPYEIEAGKGYYKVRIADESGKVDINRTPNVILRNLLRNFGLEFEEADTIVDSMMDWKDADDLHRLNGAESDYYMHLPNPYKSKNVEFETLEELLLVRGITPGILYGSEGKKGVMDFLTVNSGTNKINVNAAPKEVLTAIPGITPEIADEIIDYRQTKAITTLLTIKGITDKNYTLIEPYFSTYSSNRFTIESSGYKDNKKAEYGIKAVVAIINDNRYEYLSYKRGASVR